MKTRWIPLGGMMLLAAAFLFTGAETAHAFSYTTFAPPATAPGDSLDATYGIAGFTIEDFEDVYLVPGLTVSWGGGSPYSTLADTYVFTTSEWDGTKALSNHPENDIDNSLATLTSFYLDPGATSFGIGISQMEKDRQQDYQVLVNGSVFIADIMEVLYFRDADLGAPYRNLYLRIDAEAGEVITSVAFQAVGPIGAGPNGVQFDRLAFDPVPEPATLLLLGAGLLGMAGLRRRIAC